MWHMHMWTVITQGLIVHLHPNCAELDHPAGVSQHRGVPQVPLPYLCMEGCPLVGGPWPATVPDWRGGA